MRAIDAVNTFMRILCVGIVALLIGCPSTSTNTAPAPSTQQSNTKFCLDMNQPVGDDGTIGENADAERLAATGTAWVRVNFIGSFYAQYDQIVNSLKAKGLKIYMLVGSQAASDPGDLLREESSPDPPAAEQWITDYAAKFVEVVDHFRDRVRVFESFNEPNDWAGGTTHKVHPYWMAKMLQEVFLNTKYFNGHWGNSAWQVTLVSGALFSFDLTTAADYLSDVCWYGKFTLAWDWIHEQTGSYPLDGIGYHIYVAQDQSQLNEIETRVNNHLDEIWNVVTAYEGTTAKQIWVSEIGWPSTQSESFQAQALTKGLAVLKADSRVALACCFCQQDFPGGDWGLFRANWSKKASYYSFKSLASQ